MQTLYLKDYTTMVKVEIFRVRKLINSGDDKFNQKYIQYSGAVPNHTSKQN